MADLGLLLALLGTTVLVVSLAAQVLRSNPGLPSELMVATAVGVVLGPLGLDLFRVADLGPPMALLREGARLTVAIAVMSIALELPRLYVRERARSLAVLVGPGMILMWLASSFVTYWLAPVSAGVALLVGAIVTPTDPVIATSIVQGPTAEGNIPERLRHLLMGEAGANDGIAYPLVFFAIFLLGHAGDASLASWAGATLGWELLGAIGIGLVLGGTTGWIERMLSRGGLLDETSVFTVTVALTFAVLGLAASLGTDDILAVFVAGLAYNLTADPRDEARELEVEEVFNRLFTVPIFVVFGAAIPWAEWAALGWRAVALVVAILLLRRLPMVFFLQRAVEPLDRWEATVFVGWFGPIGVAALFYGTLAVREIGSSTPWILGSLVVAGSILAHGATATAATHWYGGVE
jgi:NhaP-type Na+/H+ or K+/H+ antiporter